jgi:PAS domain-containing protein
VTVWRDVESMARATDIDEEGRFLGQRLRLPLGLVVERAVYYEIVERTFAALPPESAAHLRIVTVRARPNEEAVLLETLRSRQSRLVQVGLVAHHLGRRMVAGEYEAVTVGVWPDRATIQAATGGGPERPLFEEELSRWADRIHLETYDGVEIAPRLPPVAGPPILILDDEMTIVDLTTSAAATLGWEPIDIIGRTLEDLWRTDPDAYAHGRATLRDAGSVAGEATWSVPEAGEVLVRFVARRDEPIPGRHTVLVHRWNAAPPTAPDLDAALDAAFPSRERARDVAGHGEAPPGGGASTRDRDAIT